jgi:O-antigen chain-terminating methyltransferase
MSDDLVIIHDDQIDVEDIMRQIRANIARRKGQSGERSDLDPVAVSRELWEGTIGDTARFQQQIGGVPLTRYDCDIVPRDYVIDWYIPILGPIHSVVRRVINAEVRRYLETSLHKQTRFNENVLRALRYLAQENDNLRQELEKLRASQPDSASV